MKKSTDLMSKKESAVDVGINSSSPFKLITGWLSNAINSHFDRLSDLRVYDNKRN